jgi:hypothetical protein
MRLRAITRSEYHQWGQTAIPTLVRAFGGDPQTGDAEPAYPKLVIDEFASITFIEDCGLNNEKVINCGADKLPNGYATRTK